MATRAQVDSFINKIAPLAVAQARKHGNKIFPSVCIAQACCESAYGTSPKMVNANAVFGIKVGKSQYKFGTAWKGKAYSTKTKECYDGKSYVSITDMFRAYDTIADSVEDYFDLLCTAKRYRFALNRNTPLACITGIQMAPYASSPKYINTIMTIIEKYKLTRFDGDKPVAIPQEKAKYENGKTYTLMVDLYVRRTPNGEKVKYEELTADGKSKGTADTEDNAILRKGTRVTCKGMSGKWMQIPSGYVCTESDSGKVYIT